MAEVMDAHSKTDKNLEMTQWRPVHRVVFPEDSDPTVLPLYIDWGVALATPGGTRIGDNDILSGRAARGEVKAQSEAVGQNALSASSPSLSQLERRSAVIPANTRASFATYFNAFPAGYWRQWTTVDRVKLVLKLDGAADVDVFRSTARGSFNRIDGVVNGDGLLEFEVPLTKFGDGGWLWFDLESGAQPSRLVQAEWQVPVEEATPSTKVSVTITTYNKPDDCVRQMERFAKAPDLLDRLDQLIITDQGNKLVQDADGFDEAAAALGNQFRIVRQGNLGGSGGFARGMYEGSHNERTDYVLLLDDDVVVETEGILRAVNFADFTRKPMIVGGHMLNLYERSMLHSYGEHVNLYKFQWGPVNPDLEAFDFARHSLRTTPELHQRMDVDYNGWWMCLIPKSVIREIGLSLPLFIKWDDAEYGLRAKAHGIRTVSLPGAAVWHMPWTEKDDRLDWQAYFHQRNKWVVALLYSPYKRGGAIARESLEADVKHLLSLQYSPVVLRIMALQDVLSGPGHLHRTLGTRTQEVRQLQKRFADGQVITDIESYPEVRRRRLLPRGEEPRAPRNRMQWVAKIVAAGIRQLLVPPTAQAQENPEERVAALDARWWRLGSLDSALVSTADGGGVAWYQRDPKEFRRLLAKSAQLYAQLMRNWDQLAAEYRAALPEIVSEHEWVQTFER